MPDEAREGATREWLFKADGQVFGPIGEPQLIELLFQGRVQASTEVAGEDGSWRPLSLVPGFLVHVRKAEARARVEAEVTGARRIARRRSALRATATISGAVVLLLLVGAGAWFLAVRRPWERRSRLLADFGDGIALSAVRVGSGPRSLDEVVVPDVPESPAQAQGAGPPRGSRWAGPRASRPAPSGSASGGELVLEWAPLAVKEEVSVWDAPSPAVRIMQRIKAQLDPKGIMNPGRFVGAI